MLLILTSHFIMEILLLFDIYKASCSPASTRKEYGIIIDAGSTGSRIRLYGWNKLDKRSNDDYLPKFEEITNYKIRGGISKVAHDNKQLERYLITLINKVKNTIPLIARPKTEIHFMATAGMRLILEEKANDVIAKVDSILSVSTFHPFKYTSPNNAKILSGEEEAIFAWLSINYLEGVFTKKGERANQTYGILELGGASTQIVFDPKGNILDNKFPVKVGDITYELYAHSFLTYGRESVSRFVKERIVEKDTSSRNFSYSNPCMIKGDNTTEEITGKLRKFSGSANTKECKAILNNLVYKNNVEWKCNPRPCSIGTTYQPTIDKHMPFIAIGAYTYAYDPLNVYESNKKYLQIYKIWKEANRFCQTPMNKINKYKISTEYASDICMSQLYIKILLVKGYGFSITSKKIFIRNKINNQPAEWPLGAMIYMFEARRALCQDKKR